MAMGVDLQAKEGVKVWGGARGWQEGAEICFMQAAAAPCKHCGCMGHVHAAGQGAGRKMAPKDCALHPRHMHAWPCLPSAPSRTSLRQHTCHHAHRCGGGGPGRAAHAASRRASNRRHPRHDAKDAGALAR